MRHQFAAAAALCVSAAVSRAGVVLIGADRDNTLYEIDDGSISNGSGAYLFSGVTAQDTRRRALLRFDVAGAVPSGAKILSASLTLHMSRTTSATEEVALHRVLSDWGEGSSDGAGEEGNGAPSQAGDATWIHTFYPGSKWVTSGGDFGAEVSAAIGVTGDGFYTWASAGTASDVQGWLDAPGGNFGWIVLGDESAIQTAKRFDSRENPTESFRPVLRVEFAPSPGVFTLAGITAGLAAVRRRRRTDRRAAIGVL